MHDGETFETVARSHRTTIRPPHARRRVGIVGRRVCDLLRLPFGRLSHGGRDFSRRDRRLRSRSRGQRRSRCHGPFGCRIGTFNRDHRRRSARNRRGRRSRIRAHDRRRGRGRRSNRRGRDIPRSVLEHLHDVRPSEVGRRPERRGQHNRGNHPDRHPFVQGRSRERSPALGTNRRRPGFRVDLLMPVGSETTGGINASHKSAPAISPKKR